MDHFKVVKILSVLLVIVGIDCVAAFGKTDAELMQRYTETIPGTDVTFEMVPVPGGEFLLGSPDSEAGRGDDEGPQVRVRVEPFWIGKCEVTWAEYRCFMNLYEAFKLFEPLRSEFKKTGSLPDAVKIGSAVQKYLQNELMEIDAITCPTPLYDPDTTYMAGSEPDQPAVTMTQFAAKQYTKWLSRTTGHQYRLPSEAEWEYAARAGTNSPYSFGNGEDFDQYAWHDGNADYETHAVGTKKANPWGIHDIHGNVAEWTLDAYSAQLYSQIENGSLASKVIAWPTTLYPRTIRGGSWLDLPESCRSAARQKSSDPDWNLSDPNLPRSPWWFTEEESTGVGFRIIRPLAPMDKEMQKKVWDADVKQIQQDVTDRLSEGRGAQSAVDERLPAALKQLEAAGLID